MARLFDDGSTEYLQVNQAVSGLPLAFVAWFNTNDDSIYQVLLNIADKSTGDNYMYLGLAGSAAGDYLHAGIRSLGETFATAVTTGGFTANTWQHACALFVTSTDRRVLLNAGSKGTNATDRTPSNIDTTGIGYLVRDPNPTHYMSGLIAEAAVYDLSVWPGATDSDKANNFEKILPSLAKGFTPLHFPLGLVAYWDLVRGLNDKVGGYNLTASGTTVSAHPKIIQPCGVL